MPIPALLAAAPGLIQAGASLFGSGKRKRAEAAAQERYDASRAELENFQFRTLTPTKKTYSRMLL